MCREFGHCRRTARSGDSAKDAAPRRARRGMSLLVCLFVIGVTSVLLVGVLETALIQMSAVRNTTDYERALYLAGAGVHHALAEIEADSSWTGEIPATQFPPGSESSYSASVVSGQGGEVIVTGVGVSGLITRKLQVTIEPGV